MLNINQLDDLEGRILRALELIADLRDDNARLEQMNQQVTTERDQVQNENAKLNQLHDELREQLKSKEEEVASIRRQLEKTNSEMADIRNQEQILQLRIDSIFQQLDKVPRSESSKKTNLQSTQKRNQKSEPILSAQKPKPDARVGEADNISDEELQASKDEAIIIKKESDKTFSEPTTLIVSQTDAQTKASNIEDDDNPFALKSSHFDKKGSVAQSIIVLDEPFADTSVDKQEIIQEQEIAIEEKNDAYNTQKQQDGPLVDTDEIWDSDLQVATGDIETTIQKNNDGDKLLIYEEVDLDTKLTEKSTENAIDFFDLSNDDDDDNFITN